jgi:DNA-binding transcriptional regulator LsrR (DeoR family)
MAGYSEDVLIAAANLYYMSDLTQQEVSRRLNLPRVTVTRMLKRARDIGLVQITIRRDIPDLMRLALRLEQEYGLAAVWVAPSAAEADDTLAAVGRAGAELLGRLLTPGCRVGVAWSRTVKAIVPYVKRPARPPRCVNELAGSYLEPGLPFGVSWPLADMLQVPVERIPMPVLVTSRKAKDLMLQEPTIAEALANAEKVDLALVGIGDVSRDSNAVRSGYLSAEQVAEMRSKGAVGEVLMSCYDARGHAVRMSFQDRVTALDLGQIAKIPCVVAVAFGPRKLTALRGALSGDFVHGLVTDRATAEALLS